MLVCYPAPRSANSLSARRPPEVRGRIIQLQYQRDDFLLLQHARGRIPGPPCDASSNPATLVVSLGFPAPLVTNNVATPERFCSSEAGRPPPRTAPFEQMAACRRYAGLRFCALEYPSRRSGRATGAKLLSPVLSVLAASITSGPTLAETLGSFRPRRRELARTTAGPVRPKPRPQPFAAGRDRAARRAAATAELLRAVGRAAVVV